MIIVEDGSIVPNANSYTTLADARAYLLTVGYELDADDTIAEQTLIKGFNYVNSFESRYQGCRVSALQAGSFPRVGVYVNGFPLASDEIPAQLIQAQSLAAYEENQESGSLFPSGSNQTITSEEVVGAIKVSYADNGLDSSSKSFGFIDSLLGALFGSYGSVNNRVFRV
jgi:hypothetical protein